MRRYLHLPAILLALAAVVAVPRPHSASAGANQPPVVTILSPTDGASFTPGTMILFSATAIDPETGPLGGVNMFWASNIQGGLGVGTMFSRNDLITGTHVVTLRASDPTGLQTARSVTITIGVPTATPTATLTPVPTATPTHTPTPLPPTPTHTPTPLPPTPTHTPTPLPPTPTHTPTPLPPTPTHPPTPLPPTATHTSTPLPPTATGTPTALPATEPPKTAVLTKTPKHATATKTPKIATPTKTKAPSHTPTATRTPRADRCADVDGSGRVSWRDVSLIARAIGRGSEDPRYDFNGDGRVTFKDLRVALYQLGRKCHGHVPGASPTPDIIID